MIVQHFYEGGTFFMFFEYMMWIAVFILIALFVVMYRSNKSPKKLKQINNTILFVGSFGFLWGISGQMMGLIGAFDAVQMIGEGGVKPHLLAGGLKVTFIVPLYGLVLLMISSIFWFVFGNLNYEQKNK